MIFEDPDTKEDEKIVSFTKEVMKLVEKTYHDPGKGINMPDAISALAKVFAVFAAELTMHQKTEAEAKSVIGWSLNTQRTIFENIIKELGAMEKWQK